MGAKPGFFSKLVDVVVEMMGDAFPELRSRPDFVRAPRSSQPHPPLLASRCVLLLRHAPLDLTPDAADVLTISCAALPSSSSPPPPPPLLMMMVVVLVVV